jgi:hypothetical protein
LDDTFSDCHALHELQNAKIEKIFLRYMAFGLDKFLRSAKLFDVDNYARRKRRAFCFSGGNFSASLPLLPPETSHFVAQVIGAPFATGPEAFLFASADSHSNSRIWRTEICQAEALRYTTIGVSRCCAGIAPPRIYPGSRREGGGFPLSFQEARSCRAIPIRNRRCLSLRATSDFPFRARLCPAREERAEKRYDDWAWEMLGGEGKSPSDQRLD